MSNGPVQVKLPLSLGKLVAVALIVLLLILGIIGRIGWMDAGLLIATNAAILMV